MTLPFQNNRREFALIKQKDPNCEMNCLVLENGLSLLVIDSIVVTL